MKTDAHFHRSGFKTYLSLRETEFTFLGWHPWQVSEVPEGFAADLRARLEQDSRAGVGEIGLDRLRAREISEEARRVFTAQLEIAAALRRPAVLHGAKCWGEVVKECVRWSESIPAFLFHGFSRSDGLLPQIFALNGFVSVGPAVLNDHAVNYREMVKRLPGDRLLIETDKDWMCPAEDPSFASQEDLLSALVRKTAELRSCSADELLVQVEANAARFVETLT